MRSIVQRRDADAYGMIFRILLLWSYRTMLANAYDGGCEFTKLRDMRAHGAVNVPVRRIHRSCGENERRRVQKLVSYIWCIWCGRCTLAWISTI